MDNVWIERTLGKGSSGIVYLLNTESITPDRSKLALKVIDVGQNERDRKRIRTEIDIMTGVNHHHIIQYYEMYPYRDSVMLLLEYCPGRDLFDYIQSHKPDRYLPEAKVLSLSCQIASAIKFLHEKHVIHRDIKTKNIFLKHDKMVKLGDFGIARQLENTLENAETFIGTPLYMAPEILEFQPYSYKADSWSFGCCVHELMSLQYAFKQDTEPNQNIRNKILKGEYGCLPDKYSSNLCQLVDGMLVVNVHNRLDVGDVYSFLQGMMEQEEEFGALQLENLQQTLPNQKAIIKALSKYTVQINQVSSSEDEETTLSDNNQDSDSLETTGDGTILNTILSLQSSEGLETSSTNSLSEYLLHSSEYETTLSDSLETTGNGTIQNTLLSLQSSEGFETSSTGSFSEDLLQNSQSFAKEISASLRNNLVCLNMTDSSSTHEAETEDSETKQKTKRKKKKSFLKEKCKSEEEVLSLNGNHGVTLYTRGQEVKFTKNTSTPNGNHVTLFTRGQKVKFTKNTQLVTTEETEHLTLEQICEKDLGKDMYSSALGMIAVIKDQRLLENCLKDILGTTNYEKYGNFFLKQR